MKSNNEAIRLRYKELYDLNKNDEELKYIVVFNESKVNDIEKKLTIIERKCLPETLITQVATENSIVKTINLHTTKNIALFIRYGSIEKLHISLCGIINYDQLLLLACLEDCNSTFLNAISNKTNIMLAEEINKNLHDIRQDLFYKQASLSKFTSDIVKKSLSDKKTKEDLEKIEEQKNVIFKKKK